MPNMINIKICPCQGFVHKALMIMSAADNTIAILIFIVNTLADDLFFPLPEGFGVIILGTIRIHNIRRMSTSSSLMPVN